MFSFLWCTGILWTFCANRSETVLTQLHLSHLLPASCSGETNSCEFYFPAMCARWEDFYIIYPPLTACMQVTCSCQDIKIDPSPLGLLHLPAGCLDMLASSSVGWLMRSFVFIRSTVSTRRRTVPCSSLTATCTRWTPWSSTNPWRASPSTT